MWRKDRIEGKRKEDFLNEHFSYCTDEMVTA